MRSCSASTTTSESVGPLSLSPCKLFCNSAEQNSTSCFLRNAAGCSIGRGRSMHSPFLLSSSLTSY